jgi:hypothetical protein
MYSESVAIYTENVAIYTENVAIYSENLAIYSENVAINSKNIAIYSEDVKNFHLTGTPCSYVSLDKATCCLALNICLMVIYIDRNRLEIY